MKNKLKNYSFTLTEYNIEELKDSLKNNPKFKGFKSLSNLIDSLVKDILVNELELNEPKGNLSAWFKKYPKTPTKKLNNKSNKEILDIYASKFGR